jgi:predicted DNA-binding transcriptional regulator YafY
MSYQRNENGQGSGRKQMHYSPNLMDTIQNAIDNLKIAVIEYDSRENDNTIRAIEPMALIYKNRKRHLVGWCRLREDWRTFRLDRISLVKLMNETFVKRDGFNVEEFEVDDQYVNASDDSDEDDEYED